MVQGKMDKKIENLEATMSAMQKRMEDRDQERDQRFTDFQASMNELLQQVVVSFNGRDQHLGEGNRDLNREGGQGPHEAREEGSSC